MPDQLKSIILLVLISLPGVYAQIPVIPDTLIPGDPAVLFSSTRSRPDSSSAWPEDLSFPDFCTLQKDFTWKRIFLAAMVPGYIHFYAERKDWAYSIAAIRSSGYLLMGFALADQANSMDGYTKSLFEIPRTPASLQKRSERNLLLFLTGLILNAGGFAADVAHGDFMIEAEKNKVMFKYKLQLN